IEPEAGDTFAQRTARIHGRLLEDLAHVSFNGVRVLRERARRSGSAARSSMPVVFSSALGGRNQAMGFFGAPAYVVSQTPQVWLHHQVLEEHGALIFNWDAVESLFPPGLLDAL